MSVFGKVLLISGNAEFLADRARRKAVDAIRAADPECEITEAQAGDLRPGEFAGLTSPSLFSSSSAAVVYKLEELSDDVKDEVIAFAADPAPEVAVVLLHGGGAKGKAVLDKLRASSAVSEVKVAAPKYEREFIGWVRDEFRSLGQRIDEVAAALLVASVGQDLRALAGAADQLAALVVEDAPISVETVGLYFGGRADVRGYEIADATLDGRIDLAVERARWAVEAKVAPVLITSAMASGLRSLVKFATAPQGLRDNELAAHVGAPPFKLKVFRSQMRHWDIDGLAQALQAVADSDLDVKGAASDPEYAVERMVIRVAAFRKRR